MIPALRTITVAFSECFSWIWKRVVIMIVAFIAISVAIVLVLRWVPPPVSSFMIQRKVEAARKHEKDFKLSYKWVDWDHISDYIKIAAITSEDQNFATHWGFDFGSIQKAITEHEQGDGLRGASTISQQTAKNLFLWPGRSFLRKGIEAYFTVLLECLWSKKRILEVYLNIAEFGDGVYGVQAASKQYFHTSARNLSMIQSALLVTALPSPKRYNLAHPSNYMLKRRNWILQYMYYLGNTHYLDQLEK